MTETNPFLYFLPENATKLIVGSFPCFNGTDYGDWFYSGSGRNHFWKLFSELLNTPAGNLEQKMALCEKYGIAITDVASKVQRKKGNCSDANLRVLEYNHEGLEKCLSKNISAIFFTGSFAATHFKKIYPEIKIPMHLLISPSPAANIHIGGLQEYKDLKLKKITQTPYEYRLLKYRQLFLE